MSQSKYSSRRQTRTFKNEFEKIGCEKIYDLVKEKNKDNKLPEDFFIS
jgi:hypothetical protein